MLLSAFGSHLIPSFFISNSGAYRPGFCYLEFAAKKGVQYTIVPSTFNRGEVIERTVSLIRLDASLGRGILLDLWGQVQVLVRQTGPVEVSFMEDAFLAC
jgi:hypothetical protein